MHVEHLIVASIAASIVLLRRGVTLSARNDKRTVVDAFDAPRHVISKHLR
jgi:hypothetical protein